MGLLSSIGKAVGGVVNAIGGGSVVGSLISGGASLIGGQQANSATAASTREQMEFQERMSSTAHQREVKDLIAAGLNPVLSAKYGGASTPSGASYTAQDVVTPAISSALQTKRVNAEVNNMQAMTDNIYAQNDKLKSDTALNFDLMKAARADALLKSNSAKVAAANADIAEYRKVGERLQAQVNKHPLGRAAALLQRFNPFAGSAASLNNSFGKD